MVPETVTCAAEEDTYGSNTYIAREKEKIEKSPLVYLINKPSYLLNVR